MVPKKRRGLAEISTGRATIHQLREGEDPLFVEAPMNRPTSSFMAFVTALACIASGCARIDDSNEIDGGDDGSSAPRDAARVDAALPSIGADADVGVLTADAAPCPPGTSVCIDGDTLRSSWPVRDDAGACGFEHADWKCPESAVAPNCFQGGCRMSQGTK